MNAFWGLGQLMFSKTVIVVDKDVDVQNEAEVAWIVGTHYDPERDIQFTRGPVDDLDDASDLPAYGSKMGIDATRKWASEGFKRNWPTKIATTAAAGAEGDEMWQKIARGLEGVTPRNTSAARDPGPDRRRRRLATTFAGGCTAPGRRSFACSRYTWTLPRRTLPAMCTPVNSGSSGNRDARSGRGGQRATAALAQDAGDRFFRSRTWWPACAGLRHRPVAGCTEAGSRRRRRHLDRLGDDACDVAAASATPGWRLTIDRPRAPTTAARSLCRAAAALQGSSVRARRLQSVRAAAAADVRPQADHRV